MKDEKTQGFYRASIKIYQGNIKKLEKEDKDIFEKCRQDPDNAAEKLFYLADLMLNLGSNYLVINGISNAIFNMKDESSLNDARKSIFKALVYLGNVVTEKVDASFSEYEANLMELAGVSPERKYALLLKAGAIIDLLKNAYGENNKWKWSFVELDGRYAVIAKNLFDLKTATSFLDPYSEHYESTTRHFELLKTLLTEAADKYHERFNLFSKRPDDLAKAVNILNGYYKILIMIPDKEEAYNVLRKVSNWSSEFELESQKHLKQSRQG